MQEKFEDINNGNAELQDYLFASFGGALKLDISRTIDGKVLIVIWAKGKSDWINDVKHEAEEFAGEIQSGDIDDASEGAIKIADIIIDKGVEVKMRVE